MLEQKTSLRQIHLESDQILNEKIKQLVEQVESALNALEKSFFITRSEKKKNTEKKNDYNNYSKANVIQISKPEINVLRKKKNEKLANVKKEEISSEKFVEEKLKQNAMKLLENSEKVSKDHKIVQTKEVEPSIIEHLKHLKSLKEEKDDVISKDSSNEIFLIDFLPTTKIIHIYGAPGAGKTTFALQSALEAYPRKTVYFYNSTSIGITKRLQQMISSRRWKEKNMQNYIYLTFFNDLDDLYSGLNEIEKVTGELALIVIDSITASVRGLLHKEETKNAIRRIMERLLIITNEKNCKVILVNGLSYKGIPSANDLIESYSDETIELKKHGNVIQILTEYDIRTTTTGNEGFVNIAINLYY